MLHFSDSFLLRVSLLTTGMLLWAAASWAAPDPAPNPAGEAPVARAYLNWVKKDIDAIEGDMPQFSAAADAVAPAFIKTGSLYVVGESGFERDLVLHRGGMLRGVRTTGTNWPPAAGPVIFPLGLAHLGEDEAQLVAKQIDRAARYHAAGNVAIMVASVAELKALGLLDRAKAASDFLLDNHAGAVDGMVFSQDDPTRFPTYPVATVVADWTLLSEVFAACTRLGQTPVVTKCPTDDPHYVHWHQYDNQAFHSDLRVLPVPAGMLGKEYNDALRSLLSDIGTTSWESVAQACDRMAATIEDGGRVYIEAPNRQGVYPGDHVAADPGPFFLIYAEDGYRQVGFPGRKDFALAFGYTAGPDEIDQNYHERAWPEASVIRQAGRGVCWVATTKYGLDPHQIPANEILVDSRWERGDALAAIPGYPLKLCPPSGVVDQILRWAMEAQVHASVHATGQTMEMEQNPVQTPATPAPSIRPTPPRRGRK